MPPFAKLPQELVLMVAKEIGPSQDLSAFRRVNKTHYNMLTDEHCKMEMELNGNQKMVQAASEGDIPAVRLFLENNADINGMNDFRVVDDHHCYTLFSTAVFAAVENAQVQMVKELASRDADLDLEACGVTALIRAIDLANIYGDSATECVRILLEFGASTEYRTIGTGRCAIQAAICNPNVDALKLLVQYVPDLCSQQFDGYAGDNALQLAARTLIEPTQTAQAKEVMEILILAGIDVKAPNRMGKTALQVYIDAATGARVRKDADICLLLWRGL